MRIQTIILFLTCCLLSFFGCKKNKPISLPLLPANDPPLCRIIRVEDTSIYLLQKNVTNIFYDTSGRIKEIHLNGQLNKSFDYFDSLIVVSYQVSDKKDSVFLNSKSMVKRTRNNFFSTATHNIYDSLGQLTKWYHASNSGIGPSFLCKWDNRDFVHARSASTTMQTPYLYEATFYTDINVPYAELINSPYYFDYGAIAVKGNHLLKSQYQIQGSDTIYRSYSYTFDSQGKPVTLIIDNGVGVRHIYYECP